MIPLRIDNRLMMPISQSEMRSALNAHEQNTQANSATKQQFARPEKHQMNCKTNDRHLQISVAK